MFQSLPSRRIRSQWSLTFEVRKSQGAPVIFGYPELSQWSLTFEVRKSGQNSGLCTGSTGRNGA